MQGDLWSALEALPLAARIGESWWFPLLESLHVLTAMFVVGSILMVDLRLLGIAAMRYPRQPFSSELLTWTWASFVVAVATGAGMFITRASWYIANPAFRLKLLMLALAGINMAAFQCWSVRRADDIGASRPAAAARMAGAASLILWAGITLAGRWTGHLS